MGSTVIVNESNTVSAYGSKVLKTFTNYSGLFSINAVSNYSPYSTKPSWTWIDYYNSDTDKTITLSSSCGTMNSSNPNLSGANAVIRLKNNDTITIRGYTEVSTNLSYTIFIARII